jgi:hypothetical protein
MPPAEFYFMSYIDGSIQTILLGVFFLYITFFLVILFSNFLKKIFIIIFEKKDKEFYEK